MYIALKDFRCKVTKKVFRAGKEYTGDRADELEEAGFIAEVKEKTSREFPKHIAGGNYQLSNGEKVKGKEAAFKAQDELDAANGTGGK